VKAKLVVICFLLSMNLQGKKLNITKVVIPAAGFGTRFLPLTKTIPKEMLPVGNKPAIQVMVEEAIDAGITDVCMIIKKEKQALIDYFKPNPELESKLTPKKLKRLDSIKKIVDTANFHYVEQPEALGLGHAILLSKEVVGNEFFGIILPDDLILGDEPELGRLIKAAEKHNASVIAVEEVPKEKVSSYGIISIKQELEDGLFEIGDLVEKPPVNEAPSNLAITGHYVLSPLIFPSLEQTKPGAGGEIQLTDGIKHMMQNNPDHKVLAIKIKGTRHDLGTPQGWVKAINDIAQREGWLD